MWRGPKMFIVIVASVGAMLLAVSAYYVLEQWRLYHLAQITDVLVREREYRPSDHFDYDRACVFPPEFGRDERMLSSEGYRDINPILPDTFTHWVLVLANRQDRTMRTLYVLDPVVKFGGQIVCGRRVVLHAKEIDGRFEASVTVESGDDQ